VRRPLRLLALDLGAESGRAIVGRFDGSILSLEEVRRFPNVPVRVGGTLYWDILRLYGDVRAGISAALGNGELATLGVDAWGVDFGLLDRRGRLLSNPVHYRDRRTDGMLEHAARRVPRKVIYAHTGIQFMPINTLYQLLSMAEDNDPDLERADKLLLIPDLLHHFLCGSGVVEYTNATTTQCLDVRTRSWGLELLVRMGIPSRIFPEVVQPGTLLGHFSDESGASVRVVAPATHDTASAVAGTPLSENGTSAFLSSGTWSLVGLEVDQPLVSEAAREANLTNEGGVGGTIRLLRNVMGLWLVQEARRALERRGVTYSYPQLSAVAEAAPAFTAFVDPDDPRFLRPGELPAIVEEFCRETSQPEPREPGTLVRVLLDSLALKYAVVLRLLEQVTQRTIEVIHVVGGGASNALLCQLTANATGRTVLAGPAEASAIGNLLVQAMALGELGSLADARALVAASFPSRRYVPRGDWSEPRERFESIINVDGGVVAAHPR
jgi:rhamnulokinase